MNTVSTMTATKATTETVVMLMTMMTPEALLILRTMMTVVLMTTAVVPTKTKRKKQSGPRARGR